VQSGVARREGQQRTDTSRSTQLLEPFLNVGHVGLCLDGVVVGEVEDGRGDSVKLELGSGQP
jgi:hypothetical protein